MQESRVTAHQGSILPVYLIHAERRFPDGSNRAARKHKGPVEGPFAFAGYGAITAGDQ
jgi:hypothetical protein